MIFYYELDADLMIVLNCDNIYICQCWDISLD
jgi:hypothetical protein